MADVRVIKFDVGSATDKTLARVQHNLHATTNTEAFRRSVAIADYVTQAQAKGRKVLIETDDGTYQELVLG